MSRDSNLFKANLSLILFFVLTISVFPNYLPEKISHFPFSGDEEYLAFAEEMPSPVGGLEAIMKSIVYPSLAKNAGVQGKVFLLAYINERGGVDDVKVVKGIGAGCDEAAVDAVKKNKFNPGKNKGSAVKVKLSLTINFKLA
ncbi:MAG: energy transducer TonB [Ignavibacteriales bacterium]|nr:MAG: energy transducer TonB [Ignavibacteriales bacterium]